MIALEAALWAVLLWSGVRACGRNRFAVGLFLAALALRSVMPWVPLNWYMGVANLPLAAFSRPTTTLPLPNRLILSALGFDGLVVWNILAGALCPVLAWDAARRSGYPERVAQVLGLFVALIPAYVRVAASDASHGVSLLLWLVAAGAFARAILGSRAALVSMVAAIVLGAPIRVESTLMFAAIPLFIGVAPDGRLRRRELAIFAAAWVAGAALSWHWLGQSWSERLHGMPGVPGLVAAVALRTALLVNPVPDYFLPLPVVALGWYALAAGSRRRKWLAARLVPIALCSLPFAAHAVIFNNLPAAAYHLIFLVFLLLPCAEGLVLLAETRRWAAVLAAVVVVVSCVPAWRLTYAYQEEHHFLQGHLPRGPARILAIFDPETGTGDLDSSLALPYATLLADFPQLRWTVLTRRDRVRWEELDFDYYYPGSMAAVPPDSIDDWLVSRLARKLLPFPIAHADEEQRLQKEHLRAIAELDRQVHEHFSLVPVAEKTAPARTFGSASFPGGRTTFRLFARIPGSLVE